MGPQHSSRGRIPVTETALSNRAAAEIARISAAGRSAARDGRWADVRRHGQDILSRQRDNAEGLFLLGLANAGLGRGDTASSNFARALRSDPGRYDAAVELAANHLATGGHAEAAALVRAQIAAMQESPLYLSRAAGLLIKLGLPQEAWPLIVRATALQPGVPSLLAIKAECAVYAGEIDEAVDIYRELLQIQPGHQRNHFELSRLRRAEDDEHVVTMQRLLEESRQPEERNIFLYYALGKELEDLQRWDEAFEYFRRGGAAAKSLGEYRVESDVALIDTVIETCSSKWLGDAARAGDRSSAEKTPVFVVGLPRTGTTLVERILTSHSMVESVGESFFLQSAVRSSVGTTKGGPITPQIFRSAAEKNVQRIFDNYLRNVGYRFGDKPFFIEKLPENVLYLGFVAQARNDARIVLLHRNPMDTCFALFKQSYFRFAYDLDDLASYYIAYDKLRKHWLDVLGDRIVCVDYESIVASQEQQTRALLDGLGLGFESQCLSFEKNTTAINTASSVQVREKIHARSVQKWKRFESQLAPLIEALQGAGIDVGA